jgi:DNA-binding response OmpR family regulator
VAGAEPDLLHVLVIDDDEDMRQLLTRILLPSGYQVVSAASAEAGLELLPYYTFQVALLDRRLPGMEGIVLGEYLRRNNPHMRIALVTGEADAEVMRFCEQHQMAVIHKPFEVKQILDLITAYQDEQKKRIEAEQSKREIADYDPPFARYKGVLAEVFDVPNLPKRIEERLVHTVKTALNELRTVSRYDERDRVVALAGLLTLQSLGIKPPKTSSGRTLFEEYDALMKEHHRRTEFEDVSSRRDS